MCLSGSMEACRGKPSDDVVRTQTRHSIQCLEEPPGRGRQGKTLPHACGGDVIGEGVKIPPGGSDQSHALTWQLGWKSRQVRSTSAGVGSTRPGDRRVRANDKARRSDETSDGE